MDPPTPLATVTRVLDPRDPQPAVIAEAAAVLRAGGLVAFPTETVYGLGALADDAQCVARIYAAKGRPATNPLIVHVLDAAGAAAIAGAWPPAAQALAEAFWPGPLTLVVPRGPRIPALVSAGRDTMAVRAPRHPVARALITALGRPLAAPSANPSNQLSPTRAEHVLKGLAGRIEMVLDGGACPVGIESTVVDVTRTPAVVLRPGSITLEQLARHAPGGVRAHDDAAATSPADADASPALSPGTGALHYAPRARLVIAPREALEARVASATPPVGLVHRGAPPRALVAHARALPDEPGGYAAALFATLHELDDAGCATIVVEAVPSAPAWDAVRDRLARGSSAR